MKIGITERGDAALDFDTWRPKLDTIDGAILITKDPTQLLDRIAEFDTRKCIIHCTVTGWGGTKLEPHVPQPAVSLEAYRKLVAEFGGDRIVLRIDPIILLPRGVRQAERVHEEALGRVRISFLDMYQHVQGRLRATYPGLLEGWQSTYGDALHANLDDRELCKRVSFPEAEICGEPGMECTGCVSQRDLNVLGLDAPPAGKSRQRAACACLAVKTELLNRRHPCSHGCLYCYWK